MDSKKYGLTLIFWERWGDKGEARDYTAELLETDKGVLAILKGFVEEAVETSTKAVIEGSTSKFSRFSRICRKKIKVLADLADLDERIDKMDIVKLSEENCKIIELYKNPRESSGVVRGEQHHFPLR